MDASSSTKTESEIISAASKLFEGYQLQVGEGESALSWQLPSGLTWRKKIWPRQSAPRSLHRWSTVEEILSYLISFGSRAKWITTEVPVKPPSGTILFYDRMKTKNYRSDGYDWKTRKSNASIREDRMKLKVCGIQLLYGCYTHCASIPHLHRRSYWLIQDPDIIMVHYLEVEGGEVMMPINHISPGTNLDEAELHRSLAPSNWSYLTISDKNLCSILAQCNTPVEIQTLTSQLCLTLTQNFTKASSLDHAIATNNSGLPFDWIKDAQPKKQRARVAPKESGFSVGVEGGGGGGGGGGNTRLINIGGVTTRTGVVADQINDGQILKALSSSPHIILCCPQNGSVSYVLLNGASLGSGAGLRGGGGTGEEERGRDQGERNPQNNISIPSPGQFENHKIRDSPSFQSSTEGYKGKGKAKVEPENHHGDYDWSKFNNFASRLAEGDPLQGFVGLETTGPLDDEKLSDPRVLANGGEANSTMQQWTTTSLTNKTSEIPTEEMDLLRRRVGLPCPGLQSSVGTTTNNDEADDRDDDLFDIPLNLDPESVRDLLRVRMSPEKMEEGRREEKVLDGWEDRGGGGGGGGGGSTLSPISLLMQSLLPVAGNEEVGGGQGGGGGGGGGGEEMYLQGVPSSTEEMMHKVATSTSESNLLTDPQFERRADDGTATGEGEYIDIHSAQFKGLNPTRQSMSHNNSPLSSSLSIFPAEPIDSSYKWEDLLHRPSANLGQFEESQLTHSHSAEGQPQSLMFDSTTTPVTTTSSSSSGLFSVPSHLPFTQHDDGSPSNSLGVQSNPGTTASHLPLSNTAAAAAGIQSLFTQFEPPPPPVSSLPDNSSGFPTDMEPLSVLSRAQNIFPSSSASSSSSLHHSPSLPRPSSPSTVSFPDNTTGIPGHIETCLLSGQSSLSPSPRPLSNIPEGIPMNILLNTMNQLPHHHVPPGSGGNFAEQAIGLSFAPSSSYRVPKSPTPSSPSMGSVSGHSTVSSLFDPGGESPSVLELCELLSESPNVRQHDFSNTTFTDMEQKQLYKAIQIIQNTFRKFKTQWQHLPRVEDRQKHAALLIENYYTRYRQLKQQQDRAARRIQHNYRMYRNRSREMNRAALFIQQMYRFHRIKRHHPDTIIPPPLPHPNR